MKNSEKITLNFIRSYDDLSDKTEYNLVALNLMTLSNIRLFHDSRNIYWVDGIVGRYFLKIKGFNCRKYPGRELLKDFLKSETQFDVIGSIPERFDMRKSIKFHHELSRYREDIETLYLQHLGHVPIVCTLPSPLQEDFALRLNRGAVLCVGGALNMLYSEILIPPPIEMLGLEFLWRLRTDTRRRINRLVKSLYKFALNLRTISRITVNEI